MTFDLKAMRWSHGRWREARLRPGSAAKVYNDGNVWVAPAHLVDSYQLGDPRLLNVPATASSSSVSRFMSCGPYWPRPSGQPRSGTLALLHGIRRPHEQVLQCCQHVLALYAKASRIKRQSLDHLVAHENCRVMASLSGTPRSSIVNEATIRSAIHTQIIDDVLRQWIKRDDLVRILVDVNLATVEVVEAVVEAMTVEGEIVQRTNAQGDVEVARRTTR